MALIEEALFTRLSGFAGLVALVAARIYPVVLPQDVTLPAVSYQRVSGPRTSAMGSDPGLSHPRFEVSAWSEDYLTAKTVKEQIRAALQRWRGTVSGVVVIDTFLLGERDLYDPATLLYHVPVDVVIHHRE